MKAVRIAFVTAVISLMWVSISLSADAKIGIVDFERIIQESTAGRAARAEVEKEKERIESSLMETGREIEDLKSKLEAEALVMSREMREQKGREFRIKVNDFKELQKKSAQDFRVFEAKIIQRIQKDVYEIVKQIGEKGDYLLIIEKGAVLYYPNAIDVTDELLKRYNAKTR
ncbi:MAG: OmpH family outer membrane protein [Thermodesulfobacteriota bacterium]